jgi:hypothetical protein
MMFTVTAIWDHDALCWFGYCDTMNIAADAHTVDELLTKIRTAVHARHCGSTKEPIALLMDVTVLV